MPILDRTAYYQHSALSSKTQTKQTQKPMHKYSYICIEIGKNFTLNNNLVYVLQYYKDNS